MSTTMFANFDPELPDLKLLKFPKIGKRLPLVNEILSLKLEISEQLTELEEKIG